VLKKKGNIKKNKRRHYGEITGMETKEKGKKGVG